MSHANAMKGKIAMGRGQIPTYADDEIWRDTLEEVIGLRSLSGDKVTEAQLARVIDFLASKGAVFASGTKSKKPYKAKAAQRRSDFYEIPDGPLAPLKRGICAMWRGLGYDMTSLDTRVKRQNGTETLRWCQDEDFLHTLARDLSKRLDAKKKKAKASA